MLIRVITRSVNYSSALLGTLELSLLIDLMLPFSTPLNNENKQKAFCCSCDRKDRSANTTGAQGWGSQAEDLNPLGCGMCLEHGTKGSLFWEGELPSWGSPLPPHVGSLGSGLVQAEWRKSAGTSWISAALYEYSSVFREKLCTLFPRWKEKNYLFFFHFFILPIKFNPSTWLLDGYQCSRVVRHSLAQNLHWRVRWGYFWVRY